MHFAAYQVNIDTAVAVGEGAQDGIALPLELLDLLHAQRFEIQPVELDDLDQPVILGDDCLVVVVDGVGDHLADRHLAVIGACPSRRRHAQR